MKDLTKVAKQILELSGKATEGPWVYDHDYYPLGIIRSMISCEDRVVGRHGVNHQRNSALICLLRNHAEELVNQVLGECNFTYNESEEYSDGWYETECGVRTEKKLHEGVFKFCPFCGKRIREKESDV